MNRTFKNYKTEHKKKKKNRLRVLKLNYFNLTHYTLKTGLMERDTIKQNETAHLYVYINQQSVCINLIDCKVSLSLGKAIDKIKTKKKKLLQTEYKVTSCSNGLYIYRQIDTLDCKNIAADDVDIKQTIYVNNNIYRLCIAFNWCNNLMPLNYFHFGSFLSKY